MGVLSFFSNAFKSIGRMFRPAAKRGFVPSYFAYVDSGDWNDPNNGNPRLLAIATTITGFPAQMCYHYANTPTAPRGKISVIPNRSANIACCEYPTTIRQGLLAGVA